MCRVLFLLKENSLPTVLFAYLKLVTEIVLVRGTENSRFGQHLACSVWSCNWSPNENSLLQGLFVLYHLFLSLGSF